MTRPPPTSPSFLYTPLFRSPSLFFFNDTATTEIYTLSLHDALPIFLKTQGFRLEDSQVGTAERLLKLVAIAASLRDRKSTRLNSSHQIISYAVFCLKKKKRTKEHNPEPQSPDHLACRLLPRKNYEVI